MVIYSAHDGTILSLLARFGIDKMKEAEFGGNIIFELHEKQPGKFTVEFRYNNDPNIFGESKKIPVTSERVDEYLSYGLLENGDVPLEAFTTFYTLEKLAESQQAFLDLHMKVRGVNPNLRASKFKKFLHNNYIRKGIRKRKASIAKALGGAYALEVWKKHEVANITIYRVLRRYGPSSFKRGDGYAQWAKQGSDFGMKVEPPKCLKDFSCLMRMIWHGYG